MSYSSSVTERSSPQDYLTFLDFPHAHDPTHVSAVAALSTDLLRQIPTDVHGSLWQLQESTSIVYASYIRLFGLLDERFERLTLLPTSAGCKQPAPIHTPPTTFLLTPIQILNVLSPTTSTNSPLSVAICLKMHTQTGSTKLLSSDSISISI